MCTPDKYIGRKTDEELRQDLDKRQRQAARETTPDEKERRIRQIARIMVEQERRARVNEPAPRGGICPMQAEILLHAYSIRSPYHMRGDAQEKYVTQMERHGMLTITLVAPKHAILTATERGRAWVEKILSVPFPTEKTTTEWVFGE